MRTALLAAAIAALAFPSSAKTPPVTDAPSPAANAADPFLWLEEARGARALAWVEKENARSLAVLEGDPRYLAFHTEALKIVDAADRIPMPDLLGEAVMNFWQDPVHVRGLWRRTTREGYAAAQPPWESVIDLDALSAAEKANWVWKGATCPPPNFRLCLVRLSDGGEDAVQVREFDLASRSFVAGGFFLPRSKQSADWLDDDTLILARDWGPGTMTTSGYGFVVKTLKRGQPLDQASEVFRGKPTDVTVDAQVLHDGAGHKVVIIVRAVNFFEFEHYLLTAKGLVRLPLPPKSRVEGLIDGALIVSLKEDWAPAPGAPTAPQGALIAVDLASLEAGAAPRVQVLIAPGPRQSVEQAVVTRSRVVAALYDNVKGSLVTFERAGAGWRKGVLPVAANSSVGLVAAGETDDAIYWAVEGFLDPTRLWQGDAASGEARDIKVLPAKFDASGDEVDQFEATSSDGAKIPYFVVHPKTMRLDGANPTLLYAYGGFQASMLPSYSANIGKLWLEHGGVYVLANIRGGGEFGPAWHEAGLKTHRQLIFDDFAAVGKDIIARGITSPRRLGIEGGSNGGLLMGVEFNQHPELWRAVVIQVPLLDMLRYEKIGAGASWAGEYGSVDNPAERAFLASISPYQNLVAGKAHPEPFFVTSTKDDRVTPVHARKMAAKMAALGLPFLFFENTNGGHAASANLQERAQRVALEFTYLARKLLD
ncbi:MAG TPA: prolyl oligopeptidase family serine peptidase [Caulobacteraceae bacterium]